MRKKRVEIPMEIRRAWAPDSDFEKELKAWAPPKKRRPSGKGRIKKGRGWRS